jgi:hypothetical protein
MIPVVNVVFEQWMVVLFVTLNAPDQLPYMPNLLVKFLGVYDMILQVYMLNKTVLIFG